MASTALTATAHILLGFGVQQEGGKLLSHVSSTRSWLIDSLHDPDFLKLSDVLECSEARLAMHPTLCTTSTA